MLNKWDIDVDVSGMPEAVATAFADLTGGLVGAEYMPIAYLGSQQAHGVNHAILVEQVLTTGRDTHNVALMILNVRPEGCAIVSIERVIEGGMPLGGMHVEPTADIPEDAAAAWSEAFGGHVGAQVEPIALLGCQVMQEACYIFAATVTPAARDAACSVAVVTITPARGTLHISGLLDNRQAASLGYAFTWLSDGLGKPLGEWP